MRLLLLICVAAGVVTAQSSAPLRKSIPAIAKSASGAVVSIIMFDKDRQPIAQGTGFLVSKDGRILTNYHVIEQGSSAIVKLPDGAFFMVDGVLASDKARDLAVIKAHGENFHTLTLGNSDRLRVGQEVVAIGNPLSLESTVSNGIVSGIRVPAGQNPSNIEGLPAEKLLQITAPISPGSSGGPLFNMAGQVVGITTLYIKGGENLNFAIPINDAKPLLQTEPEFEKYAVIQPLPNEAATGGPSSAGSESEKRSPPISDRDYYKQVLDAGGFYVPLAQDASGSSVMGQNASYACFSDKRDSGTFFTILARAYNQDFFEATRKGLKAVQENDESEGAKQQAILQGIQKQSPYIWFLNIVDFRSLSPEDQRFYLSGGRTLFLTLYDKRVETNTQMYRWDGTSWTASIPDADAALGTSKTTIFQLSIDPSTMHYVWSMTISTTAGSGATAVADETHYSLSQGACEEIPGPK